MDDAARIETVKQYLRRTYANNLNGLKALSARIAECAFEAVTITGHSAEGANVQGQLTFEPLAYLSCVEQLILEQDAALDTPLVPTPPSDATIIDFSTRYHTT